MTSLAHPQDDGPQMPAGRLVVGVEAMPPALISPDPMDPIARALAAWMRSLEQGSLRTARAYQREVRCFLAFLGQSYGPGLGSLLRARPSDCTAYIHATPGLASASRALKAAVLRGLFGVLVRDELRTSNPAADVHVRHAKSGNHHRAPPSSLVTEALRRLADSTDPQDIRDRALLLVMLNLAARRHEVASLNVGSIQRSSDGQAHVQFVGKGGKAARMALHASVVAAVDRWLAVAGHGLDPAAPLFHSLSRRPDHRGGRLSGAGIACIVHRRLPGFTPHGLRARSISDVWLESGRNLHIAQSFARHGNASITADVYVRPLTDAWSQGFATDYGTAKV